MNKKVTDNDVDVTDMTTPKQSSKAVKNENDIVDDNSNNKDEVNASSSEKKAKETQTKIADAVNKENTKNVVTDQEKDKEDQLKEIEEEKEEIERKTKSKANSMKTGDEKTQDAQDTVKSWKEEEKILLAKLKNPFLDENSKLKKYKDEEEEEDNGDELKKLIRSKAAKKVKKVEKSKELIQKPKNQAKLKKERLQKTKKDTKKAVSNSKSKQDIGNVATSSKATDKELYAAVDSMFGGKAGKEKGAQDVQQKSAAVLKTPIPTSPLKGKLSEKNLKQLEKFKNQILSEVAKIDSLEKEYGKDSHSTKDLFEAKEVLQKDLKVVKELERSLLKNSAIQKPKKSVAQSQKSNKDNKKHQVSPPVKPVNADLETINSLTSSINSDLGVDKNPIDKLDSEEVIPEAKLGFDAVSEEEKEQDREEEKIADAEEVKLFKGSSSLAKGKTKSKSHDNAKGHSYEYAYYMGGKSTHEEEEDKKKKKQHPLEDIHALLKAEIKRLRVKKKDHKSDTQLANIRKLVQQRLKSMLASGELDKTAFHSLAPEIKELGQLLKHRIKNENQNLKKIGKSKKKGKSLKKAKKVKKMNPVGGKDLLNVQQGPESLPSGEANVIENIQQVGQASPEQPQSMPLKYKNQASQGDSESNVNEQQEPEGILPHLQGNSKEKIDADMAKDMQELDNSLSNQDVFSKIEKAHPEQSNKMKTLLTTLNQKLGEIYSKASKAQKPVSGAAAHMNLSPNHVPETPHQAQQVPQPPANIQPQQTQQEPHPQPPPITQQRQESPVPSLSHEQQSNVSMYQSQLASEASNTLPGIYPPQTFASPQSSALASPVVPQNSAGVVSTSYPQENAAVAPTNQAAEKSEPQNMYNLPAEGKNDLPSNNMQQPLSPTTEDFEFEDTAPQKALAGDEPVDTLVESLERDITEVWSYRDMFPDADSLGLDNEKVHNTYANLGSLSGLNLRRALKRALRGEDVGLAVVGGSISKGGPFSEKGLDYVLRSYFYAVEDYWNKIIRPVTGSSMIIRDVSIGGIATDYYSYCLQNHLPDDRLTNIVLWELSANDMRRYDEGLRPKPQPLEQFTRNVLSYRARPALIFVNFFALFDWDPDLSTHCRNYEDEGEDDVSRYYKITSLSWRNMVCPLLRAGTQPLFTRSRLFAEDNFHPSILGHAQMSYIIIDYIRTEFLKNLVKMRNTFIADAVTRLQIPKSIYIPRPMYPQTYLWKPLCHTYMLVDNRSPNNTLPLDEDHSSNFRYTVVREFKIRSDKIVGMETKQKDQFLRYRIHVPRHQNGGMEPYKRLGIMTFTDDRQAQIQYDAENPKNLDSRKKFLEGTLMKYVGENISPGEHELTIKSGSTGFLVCALVLG